MNTPLIHSKICSLIATAALTLAAGVPASARVLDDFNDNTKTDWTDFTFVPGFGLPSETSGQFRFNMPAAGQDIFSASQKVSESFELKEGRTIEYRVDLIEGSGEDAFAVLAFIPNTGGNTPGTLAGYGLAKDPTDVLITKGVQKYFVDDDEVTAELKHENVTLSLTLSARGGNVTITGKILDKDNNNAVLWERTVVDTPAADILENGTDDPAAPYITTGYFTLYCYQQSNAAISEYAVHYDNAEVSILDETVLDDFNDNAKTDWSDFTFVPGFGLPSETSGQFRFEMPPAGQDIFSASQKTSRQFELVEGGRLEFRVDLIGGSGADAFAVLAFIPNTGGNTPGTLAGYGLAKDPDDVLMTKGVQKYFVADDTATAELKNENVTLSLALSVQNGNVTVTGKILDRDNNNAVIWERTVVDTPAADIMEDGTDDPAAPYLTTGYFTLYCYQQFNAAIEGYAVYYDNAVVVAPPVAANVAPIISEVQPTEFANFLPASTKISFKVTDDQALSQDKLSVTLNGTVYTTANGLLIEGAAAAPTVTLGGLAANVDYTAILNAEDAGGLTASRTLYFDTFTTDLRVVEVEDYNFEAGQFINNPQPTSEGNGPAGGSYSMQTGTSEVDYLDTRTAPSGNDTLYRQFDPVRMAHSRDFARQKFTAAGGADNMVFDYDVGDIATGEWLQFTRSFASGTYEVYLRQALANMASGESLLERVTGDRTQPAATTQVLGSFLGERTGFQYRNFALTDGAGQNKVIVRLEGETTLRLRQVTADPDDGARLQNYLIFIPVADPGKQRATISSLTPARDAVVNSIAPAINAVIQNRDTTVNVASVALTVGGTAVNATVTATPDGATVAYVLNPLPAPNTVVPGRLSFHDSDGVEVAADWSFTVTYSRLDAGNARPSPGLNRGIHIRMVQAPPDSGLANSLERAEKQLALDASIPVLIDTNTVLQVVNMSQDATTAGYYVDETLVPGLEEFGNTDDFTVECRAWLDLAAGPHRFGVISDDGYKLSSGALPTAQDPVLGFVNGGPTPGTGSLIEFVAPVAGLYPFRLVWYERGGGAHAEWYSENLATGDRILINDPASGAAIKAYVDAPAPPAVQLQSSANVTTGYVTEAGATVDATAKRVTATQNGPARFYRLLSGSALRLKTIKIEGGQVVIEYE